MSKKQPTTFWPKRADIAAILAGSAPEGHDDGLYNEDGEDENGYHWYEQDDNAVEVVSVQAMDFSAEIYVRPTTRGIQWAIVASEDGVQPLDPEYTAGPITAEAIVEALQEAGLHSKS
jgi:hypothetical protein